MVARVRIVVLIVLGALGVVLAGCGKASPDAAPGGERFVAVASAPTVCGVPAAAGGHTRALAAGIHVPLVTYASVAGDANDTASSAGTTIQNARDAITLGNPAAARAELRQALALLRTSERRIETVAAPSVYSQSRIDARNACVHYAAAINEYLSAVDGKNTALLAAGDADVKTANILMAHAQTAARGGQDAAASNVQALAAHAVAVLQARAAREHRAAVAAERSPGGPTVLAASAGSRAASSGSARSNTTARSKSQVSGQNDLLSAVKKLLAQRNGVHLLYEPSIGIMQGWVPLSTGQWQPIRYAEPVNGLTSVLQFITGGAGTFLAPFTVHTPSYAVEARIHLVGYDREKSEIADRYPTDGFGIFVRSRPPVDLTTGAPGLLGGVIRIAPPAGLNDPGGDYSYAGFAPISSTIVPYAGYARFQPRSDWHTYRIEVRGEQMKLFIDGMEAAERTTNQSFMGAHVGIFSIGSRIEVSDFKVMGL